MPMGCCSRCSRSIPTISSARTALGRLLITAGEPKQGLEIIKPALAKQPNDSTLLALRGAAESALKDPAAARTDADRAVTLDPKNADAIDLRAALYRQDGNLPAAIKLVNDAATAQPAIAGFHQVLVNLYEAADQPEQAEGQLRALVKLNPEQLSYRAQLAVFLSRTKRLDDAQKVLEDAVKALPKSDDAKLLQVDFLAQVRTHFAAEQALRDYIKADSDNYTLRLALGNMLQKFGDSAKAIQVFSDIVKDTGTQPSAIIARDRLALIAVGGEARSGCPATPGRGPEGEPARQRCPGHPRRAGTRAWRLHQRHRRPARRAARSTPQREPQPRAGPGPGIPW